MKKFVVFLLSIILVPTASSAQIANSTSTATRTPAQATGPASIATAPIDRACPYAYYPPIAVRLHHEGTTILLLDVTAEGNVKDVTVKTSSGYAELDDAAAGCAQQWTYAPTKNGTPVDTQKEVTIKWRLGGPPTDVGQLLAAAANACTQKARINKEDLAMATAPTIAEIAFYHDDAPVIDVDQSSGSDALDKVFEGCLANVPPNIQMHPPFKMTFKVSFSWKPNSNAATSAAQVQSGATKPPPTNW